jgi:hypothetical protein
MVLSGAEIDELRVHGGMGTGKGAGDPRGFPNERLGGRGRG